MMNFHRASREELDLILRSNPDPHYFRQSRSSSQPIVLLACRSKPKQTKSAVVHFRASMKQSWGDVWMQDDKLLLPLPDVVLVIIREYTLAMFAGEIKYYRAQQRVTTELEERFELTHGQIFPISRLVTVNIPPPPLYVFAFCLHPR